MLLLRGRPCLQLLKHGKHIMAVQPHSVSSRISFQHRKISASKHFNLFSVFNEQDRASLSPEKLFIIRRVEVELTPCHEKDEVDKSWPVIYQNPSADNLRKVGLFMSSMFFLTIPVSLYTSWLIYNDTVSVKFEWESEAFFNERHDVELGRAKEQVMALVFSTIGIFALVFGVATRLIPRIYASPDKTEFIAISTRYLLKNTQVKFSVTDCAKTRNQHLASYLPLEIKGRKYMVHDGGFRWWTYRRLLFKTDH